MQLKVDYKILCRGYSPVWRQLWAYNTDDIIDRGRSPRQIILRVLYTHNCLQAGLYVFYTMVTQKCAIKSHLNHCCQVETIVLYQLVKTEFSG